MLSVGAINGLEDDIWYNQERCFLEVFLKDMKVSDQTKFWLETCNLHAMAIAIEAVGAAFKYQLPVGKDGRPVMSQAGFMFTYLYSRYGQQKAPVLKEGQAENEIMANIAWVAMECANVKATVYEYEKVDQFLAGLDLSLNRRSANVLSYFTDYGTGHYHTQTRKNVDGSYIVYDSWPHNKHCKNGGVREQYDQAFYAQRCNPERLRFIEVEKVG